MLWISWVIDMTPTFTPTLIDLDQVSGFLENVFNSRLGSYQGLDLTVGIVFIFGILIFIVFQVIKGGRHG